MRSTEGYITAEGGVRLFFRTMGEGPVAVIVPNGLQLIDDFTRLTDGRTLICYDLRNRGLSDPVRDPAVLGRGIHQDVADLDAVRRHFSIRDAHLIGHSYVGMTVALYAKAFPAYARRIVQIGPVPPDASREYPAHLTGIDATFAAVMTRLDQLRSEPHENPKEHCRKCWSVLRLLYVVNPADADRIRWARCELANERNFLTYWTEHVLPSIQAVKLGADDLAAITAPVLTIHGTRDRSAPYGGGRDWSRLLPNSRLLTVDHAAHAPWIEAPGKVFGSIETFFDGAWPNEATKVESLDPQSDLAAQT